jgi:lysophospholipid acyltransferase (LPLAT)-like uncharacterized protein
MGRPSGGGEKPEDLPVTMKHACLEDGCVQQQTWEKHDIPVPCGYRDIFI